MIPPIPFRKTTLLTARLGLKSEDFLSLFLCHKQWRSINLETTEYLQRLRQEINNGITYKDIEKST